MSLRQRTIPQDVLETAASAVSQLFCLVFLAGVYLRPMRSCTL